MAEPLTAAELAALRRGEGLDPARLGPYEVTSRLLDTVEARAAEIAALREIAEVVAAARWGIYPSGEHLFGMGDALALKARARALLGKEG